MVFNTGPYTDLPDNSILITANMQSETGFPSSHQFESYVAFKSRLKLAARAVLSADAGLLVYSKHVSTTRGGMRLRRPLRRMCDARCWPTAAAASRPACMWCSFWRDVRNLSRPVYRSLQCTSGDDTDLLSLCDAVQQQVGSNRWQRQLWLKSSNPSVKASQNPPPKSD